MIKFKEIMYLYIFIPIALGLMMGTINNYFDRSIIFLKNEFYFEYSHPKEADMYRKSLIQIENILEKKFPLNNRDASLLDREITFIESLAAKKYILAIRSAANVHCGGRMRTPRLTASQGRKYAILGSEMGDQRSMVHLVNCLGLVDPAA